MKSNPTKKELEEQITSMLERVMKEDQEDNDTRTVDTDIDHSVADESPSDYRKNVKKSKTTATPLLGKEAGIYFITPSFINDEPRYLLKKEQYSQYAIL
jgi:hypothetical protein